MGGAAHGTQSEEKIQEEIQDEKIEKGAGEKRRQEIREDKGGQVSQQASQGEIESRTAESGSHEIRKH